MKILSSNDVVCNRIFSSTLAYMSRPYSEAMDMHLYVTYTPHASSLREQTSDIITFAHFEEGNIWTKTCNNAESVSKSNDHSIMPLLLSKEEMDTTYSGDESITDLISTEVLEDICERNMSHPIIIRRKTCNRIRDLY